MYFLRLTLQVKNRKRIEAHIGHSFILAVLLKMEFIFILMKIFVPSNLTVSREKETSSDVMAHCSYDNFDEKL